MHPSLGTSLEGRYKIDRELGAGGMATVYLAEDIKHKRKVALKVLKPELAAVLGAERFLQEITTTAALQHPHILPLFDSGTADGFLYYVMPFIDGETLRSKLDRETQLGIEEAVRITVAVADALDYAHRHGVIHRDIKPENILLHEGRPMVADFGIALAVSAAAGGRMTETGLSLGTPHYMSPEQATAEKEISARSDVYSLASVLYEMLTGDPPHTGASAQQIIMKIVTEEAAPVTKLRKAVPRNVADAVAMALEKLPADRFDSAKAFADALQNPAFRHGYDSHPVLHARSRLDPWRLGLGYIAVVAIAVAALIGIRKTDSQNKEVARFPLALPEAQRLVVSGGTRVAFAPDGRSFVYSGPSSSGTMLWIRRLSDIDAVSIVGTEGAQSPGFSPDGTEVAFFTVAPFALKVATLASGQVRTISDNVSSGGLAWAANGYIYIDGAIGLAKVHPDGTGYEMVMPLDSLKGESGVAWPSLLPDARGLLFRVRHGGETASEYEVGVLDLRNGTRKKLLNGLIAFYSPTGHLVWAAADGSLRAQRFNLDKLELEGAPLTLWGGLATAGFGAVDLAMSSQGDLLYATGSVRNSRGDLVWVSRTGAMTRVDSTDEGGLIGHIAVSPDGKSVAMELGRGNSGPDIIRIWVKELSGGPTHLVSSEVSNNRNPVWSPDGRYLYFSSLGGEQILRRRADGSGQAERIAREARGIARMSLTPDGKVLLIRTAGSRGGDIMQLHLGVDSVAVPLLSTEANEEDPTVSPDGKWIAYSSNESGRFEVYVRPFPNVDAQKIQVSTAGGEWPMWNPRGGELFFVEHRTGAANMMDAHVQLGTQFKVSRLDRLFDATRFSYVLRQRMLSMSADGSRFMTWDVGPNTAGAGASLQLVLMQNFTTELRRRLP